MIAVTDTTCNRGNCMSRDGTQELQLKVHEFGAHTLGGMLRCTPVHPKSSKVRLTQRTPLHCSCCSFLFGQTLRQADARDCAIHLIEALGSFHSKAMQSSLIREQFDLSKFLEACLIAHDGDAEEKVIFYTAESCDAKGAESKLLYFF